MKGIRMAMALLMAAMLCIGAMAEGIDDQVIGVFGESNVLIKDEKWGIVTPDGEIIVPFEYDWMGTLDPENGLIYICQADCMDDAKRVEDMIHARHGNNVDLVVYTGSVIGAHSGPGTLALFYLGKKR